MGTRNRRKGFTLIELMIVVAIIALLIAILLPSLARAREQAMQVACAANLNSIHKGMFYYAEDAGDGNGYLPQLSSLLESSGGGGFWTTQISKYVKIKRTRAGSRNGLTVCPAHEEPQLRHVTGILAGAESSLAEKIRCDTGQGGGTRRHGGSSDGGSQSRDCQIEPVSYTGSCDTVIDSPQAPGGRFVTKWARIDRPHCFLLLTEANQRDGRGARCFRMADLLSEARNSPDYKRHYGGQSPNSNGSNYMFADGHVQWHSAEFTATKLICCMDSPAQSGVRYLQDQNCGGGSAPDGTSSRR